jgi:hypothetical protein
MAQVSEQTLPRLATLSSPVVPQQVSARSPGPSPDRVSCSPVSQGPVGGEDAPLPAHAANYVSVAELDLRAVELRLILHREPAGWGELKPGALTVDHCQDSARTDLITSRLAGVERGDAARKNSEISHTQDSGMKAGAKRPASASL